MILKNKDIVIKMHFHYDTLVITNKYFFMKSFNYHYLCKMVFTILFCLISLFSVAQVGGAAINSTGNPAEPSAILDLDSDSKGFLLPRMTTLQRSQISSPAQGLQIFNTTTKCFEAYVDGVWHSLACPGTCSVPGPAGIITGASIVCHGQTNVTYSILPVIDATSYVWNLPTGASISSGAGSSSITVDFSLNAISGFINVYATNACGDGISSSNFSVTVNPLPDAAGTIIGASDVCQGQSGVSYSVPSIVNADTYLWNLPVGATISSGLNTNNISVDFSSSAVSGNITVAGVNDCGQGTLSLDFPVIVNSAGSGSQTFNATGSIVSFTVPSCIYSITINAYGAQGGNTLPDGVGGKGARIQGTFNVVPGEVYSILVGEQGESPTANLQIGAGGGGGSYVWNNASSSLLIAAGGGGGAALQANGGGGSGSGSGYNNGAYASATTTANPCPPIGSGGAGGTSGSGGAGGAGNTPTFNMPGAGGGAGWVGDGGNGGSGGANTGGSGGKSPLNGGQGGAAGSSWGKNGGFGGGGGGAGIAGGGGGGYNGGGGGTGLSQPTGIVSSGGGGGSYNAGSNQVNTANVRAGDGQIVISW